RVADFGGLHGEAASLQQSIGIVPFVNQERRRGGPWAPLEPARNLSPQGVGVSTCRVFVVDQLQNLRGYVLETAFVEIEGDFLVEALWIEVRIASNGCALPQIGEFAAGQREPAMRDRVIGDVGAIETNGFAIEEVGEGFVAGGGVTQ